MPLITHVDPARMNATELAPILYRAVNWPVQGPAHVTPYRQLSQPEVIRWVNIAQNVLNELARLGVVR